MAKTITPSPWTLESDGITLCMGGQIVATAIAPDGAGIDEQRANAKLIASAPDMLADLAELASIIEDAHEDIYGALPDGPIPGWFMRLELAARFARSAIARAHGND